MSRFLVVLAFCWLALASPSLAQERLRIVTTTTDLRSLAETVGGERVAVTNLVPPNVDAEEYQAKPQDVVRLKDARVVVRVGLDFDLWFDRLLSQAALTQSNVRALRRGGTGHVDASQAIAVLDQRGASVGPGDGHAHASGNPHYWLDPKNAEIVTGNILETLAQVDPANGPYYEANRLAFLERLEDRLRDWDTRLAPVRGKPMIAYHNTWAYLARRFRLDFVGFIEPKPGVPPSPAHLAAIIKIMRDRSVRLVVRQPHEPERNAAFVAARASAAVVLLAGSVGALPAARDYLSLFDTNVAALSAHSMTDAIALLWPPFLVALCLIGIHTYFGIQVLSRNVIFVDLALAQIAALGTTMAFMLGHPTQGSATYLYSLAFTLLAAFLLAFTRNWSRRIPQEALIGVIYVVAAAAAILLIDRAPQGAEHLKQILTGNILITGLAEVAMIVPIYLAIGVLHWVLRRRLAAGGEKSWLWEFVFYATFGVVVTSSVALAGVLLVFSFLIMPAAVGVLFADTLRLQLAIGWVVGTLASAVGLAASYGGDLPTGAAMVCTFGATLALAGLIYPFRQGRSGEHLRRAAIVARWCVTLILLASAALLMAAPRADHPVLDSIEYLFPSVRQVYFTKAEAATYQDAAAFAERHRREADRLNELETRSRAEGQPLDDMMVRRISSFIKSYTEMRKGEEFVQREVRSRARERIRWLTGGAMLLIAFSIAPGLAVRCLKAIKRSH